MDIFEKIDDYFGKRAKAESFFNIYLFTNENINGYVPYFDLKDKSLLTVGSSCDQLINASMAGCRDITVCDICPFTKYYYYLKLASFICLNRDEFLKFFCKRYYDNYNSHFLVKKTFNRLKFVLRDMDYESYCVWDYLYTKYNKYSIDLLFRTERIKLECLLWVNNYLHDDYNYGKVKNVLLDSVINFVNGNIVTTKFDRKFDNIWFSNVANYLNYRERWQMFENGNEPLSLNGKMLLCYFWDANIINLGDYLGEFLDVGACIVMIPGLLEDSFNNSILMYKKRK